MKIKFIYFLLLIINIPINALSISFVDNCLIPSDSLIMQEVRYVQPGNAGSRVEWDFSSLEFINPNYILTYKGKLDSICATEHRTRYYLSQTTDSVFCYGFENSKTVMHFDNPQLTAVFPFSYKDTATSYFSGTGEYGYNLPIQINGNVKITADATGTLFLPDEIIRNAIRLKSEISYTNSNIDSTFIKETIYRWYAEGYRYPVFKSVQVTETKGSSNDTVRFNASFIYSKALQEQRIAERDNASVWLEGLVQTDSMHTDTTIIENLTISPNPVYDSATLTFELTKSTHVNIYVLSSSEEIMYNTKYNLPKGTNSILLPTSNFIQGRYIVYVGDANSNQMISVVLIKI